jgi:RHS repeat-associated protein
MTRLRLVVSVVLIAVGLIASPTNSTAQSYTFGIPPFSSVDGGPESINLSNLSVDYGVPIFSRSGRGAPFSLSTVIQGFNWGTGANSSGAAQWLLTLAPPSVGNPVGFVIWSVASGYTCNHGIYRESYSIWTFSAYYDANGNSHSFNLRVSNASQFCTGSGLLPPSASAVASDGSGVSMTVTDSPSAVVTLRDGTVINPAPLTTLEGWESYAYWTTNSGTFTSTDSNGNKITAAETDGYLTSVTDTLGTSVVTGPGNQNSVSYTAPSGGSAPFTFSTTRLNVQSDWGCPGVEEFPATPFNMLTKITLPDGSYYQIAYEPTTSGSTSVTGRIASVRLPTGATISYNYTGGDTGKGIVCADGSTAGFIRATPDGTWKYLRSNIVLNDGGPIVLSSTTTITDPQGNNTVVNFGGNFETQRQVYTGAATGTPLETIVTCYNGNTSNCATAQGTTYPIPITETNVFRSLNGGPNSELDTFYNSYGLVTNKNEYDFGATTPTRKTTITYDSTIGNGVVDRPSVVTVTDGAGNIKSQTAYTYDQDEVAGTLAASGASQLATVTCTASSGKCRGNATTVTSFVNAGAALTKTFVHYDTGQIYKGTDVNGAITQYTYGNCGNSLLTHVSLPLSLSQSSTWNCTGGVMTSSTDMNGQTSYTNYTTDPHFWRPESTKDQLGNVTNITYASLVQREGSLELNSTSYVDVVTTLDSLGRSSLSQTRQAPSSSYFDTSFQTYDTDGRPYKAFMPCQAGEGSGCSTSSTITTYDGMGRPWTVTDGGGGTTTYTYKENDVLQAVGPTQTFQRQLEYDGLGRLTSVCEITSAPGSGSGPCNQKNPLTGLLTLYTYDALDNLLTVTQNAQSGAIGGSQTRTYTFDGLSRLTSESNPETSNTGTNGTKTYVYDAVSNLCGNGQSGTNGDLVSTTDVAGNCVTYFYDGLHRLTDVGAGTPAGTSACKRFRYDNTLGVAGAIPPGITVSNTFGRMAEAETDNCVVSNGKLTAITDEWFSYDKDGRQTDVYESTPNSRGYYHTTASYWPNNQLETLGIKNSSGGYAVPLQTYAVDGEGRTSAVGAASGQNPVSLVTYATTGTSEPIGSLTQVTFGSSDSDVYQYDTNTGRIKQYSFNVNGQSAVGNLTWNANGTLQNLAITDPFNSQNNQSCTNTYDDLARLSGNNCGGAWAQTFSYDAFGNVTKSGSISWQPNYNNATNQYQSGWKGVSYDANGDLLNDTFNTYTWDPFGNLASANGATIVYDAFGRMVENHSGAYQFVHAPNGGKQPLAEMQGQSLLSALLPLPGGAVVAYGSSGLSQYMHADWLGSARLSSTPGRAPIPAMAYAPFGEGYAGGQQYEQFTGINAGTVYDTENQTGSLEDFMFRRYSPVQGRWISPDPAGLGAVDPSNPQSWNRYTYVLNNPLSNIDPLGLDCAYLNDAGDGLDEHGLDHDSSAGECSANGGQWLNGTIQDGTVVANADTGQVSGVNSNGGVVTNGEFVTVNGGSAPQVALQGANNDVALNPDAQKIFRMVGRQTGETTMAFNCATLGVATAIPGLGKLAGAPSYPGISGIPFIKWGLSKVQELPELGGVMESFIERVGVPLTVVNSAATAVQCYGDESNRALHW